jgi:putative RNA 2'-phosphotransferase
MRVRTRPAARYPAAVPRNLRQLSRTATHALRHEPWLYALDLDDAGWTTIEALAGALDATASEIRAMAAESDKQRFQLDGDRIRAAYGHSLPDRVEHARATPPALLFHGTDPAIVERILSQGLTPRARQYVHLAVDRTMAVQVGRRKAAEPVILQIDSAQAHAEGIAFYIGNERVWLADHVPPRFIRTA